MSNDKTLTKRRGFLKASLAVGTGVSGALTSNNASAQSNTFLEIDPWTKTQGSTFVNPPYGLPSKYEREVVRRIPNPPAIFLTLDVNPGAITSPFIPSRLFSISLQRSSCGAAGIFICISTIFISAVLMSIWICMWWNSFGSLTPPDI